MMTANDDVEAPSDFAKLSDQSDLMRGGGVRVNDVVNHSNYITSHLIVWRDVAS